MNPEEQIRQLLFEMTKEIKFHKIDRDNAIIEVDYEKYVKRILGVINSTPRNLE